MTRLERLQSRLHEIRLTGGVGSIRYAAGTPYLVYTSADPETTATRILSAKQKPAPASETRLRASC